jgi:hypothetical protein
MAEFPSTGQISAPAASYIGNLAQGFSPIAHLDGPVRLSFKMRVFFSTFPGFRGDSIG